MEVAEPVLMSNSRPRALLAVMVAAVVALALLAVPAGGVDVAHASAAPFGERGAGVVRLTVSSTSDWTSVRITPTTFVAAHAVAVQGGTLDIAGDAIGLLADGGRVSATVDVVLQDLEGVDALQVEVAKGFVGRTDVALAAGGTTALSVVNDRHSVVDHHNRMTFEVARDDVVGDGLPAMPDHHEGPRVLAFYYPWFDAYDQPGMADHPAVPRSTFRAADVAAMTGQARAAGIDGFVVSWAGEERNGDGFGLAQRAAAEQGGTVAGYLEVAQADAESRTVLEATTTARLWLQQLLVRAGQPGYLRLDGRPVVFVFGTDALSPSRWETVLAGLDVALIGDTTDPAYAHLMVADHTYAATGTVPDRAAQTWRRALANRAAAAVNPSASPRLHIETVAPGYDDRGVRSPGQVVDRADGARYDAVWDLAHAAAPDWVLVTSWNEWFEGTSIEPSTAHGDLALRQTSDHVAAFRGHAPRPEPVVPPGTVAGPDDPASGGAGAAADAPAEDPTEDPVEDVEEACPDTGWRPIFTRRCWGR